MRPALALALVLLALTIALENAAALFPRSSRARTEHAGAAVEVLAAAKGPLLPAGRLGGGPERMAEGIRIGDRTLAPGGGDGLHVARASVREGQVELRAHAIMDVATSGDVAGSGEAVRALAATVDEAAPGELLVLASTGTIRPAGDEARAELARMLERLGARARPFEAERESWAYVGLRLAAGWVPLAEGWSRDSGVVLAFVLGPDPERYRGFRGDLVHVRADGEVEVELARELRHAERADAVEPADERSVLGRALPGLALPVGGGVAWRDVELGPGSGFVAWVGLDDASGAAGARLDVRLDGATVASQPVVPGAPWRAFQVDLRRPESTRATLELVVEPPPNDGGNDGVVLLGHPLLVHGYGRSPLEALAERR